MENQKYKNLKLGERAAIISIIAYVILSIIKLTVGYIGNSTSLRADGLNNTTDIIASIAILVGLKISQKPPDKNHKYGHWKSESIAALIAAFIMIAVGLQVLIDATVSMFQAREEAPDILTAYVGIFSAISMYFVYLYNKKLANRINSKAVMAAAKDNLSDAWVSIGVAIGIFSSQLNMPWLDTVTALIVGLLICKTGWDIFTGASYELSDGFDEDKIQLYKNEILEVNGVKGVKEIKGRNYGNNEILDVVILVNSILDIKEAHDIATQVNEVMMKEFDIYDVHVHVEPDQ
ncbi:cation diffusion facilitator family transporter [Ornithinibacillus sp. 4-3]|uniref:Cation diffusion facilitator family transporter n=1 Tax=Ornithinibacillus sp. 4-3 TaxID=3231488 RepID=A0AB39HUX3_9BACI